MSGNEDLEDDLKMQAITETLVIAREKLNEVNDLVEDLKSLGANASISNSSNLNDRLMIVCSLNL